MFYVTKVLHTIYKPLDQTTINMKSCKVAFRTTLHFGISHILPMPKPEHSEGHVDADAFLFHLCKEFRVQVPLPAAGKHRHDHLALVLLSCRNLQGSPQIRWPCHKAQAGIDYCGICTVKRMPSNRQLHLPLKICQQAILLPLPTFLPHPWLLGQ